MEKFNNKKFLGIVEDNNDPDRQNKCRIRVINVFDGLPVEDLPWAVPFKDHNGLVSNLPDVGKIVSIEFENGDIYNPIYRYGEHYNVNLQEKLSTISEEDYLSMKSLLFDHVTQIYTNESEGLKLDHKFNLLNITKTTIDLALKDNYGSVNIGTADASQQAILGNNFLDWFSTFVDHLLGSQGGPYFGNLMAPIIPHPNLITHLMQYKALKEPKFLSHNVNFNDNGYVDKLSRIKKSQKGDSWKSTVEDNTLTKNVDSNFDSRSGSKNTTPDGQLTSAEGLDGEFEEFDPIELPENGDINEDVLYLIQSLNNSGYKVYDEPNKMNIVGVRYQYPGDKYSNTFSDRLYVFFKNNSGEWKIKNYKISTLPGTKIKITSGRYKKFKEKVDPSIIGKTISLKKYVKYLGRKGLGILQPAQYINSYKLGYFPRSGSYKSRALLSVGKQLAYRDNNWDSDKITFSFKDEGNNFYMHLHRGFPGGSKVNNWSEGCQVFPTDASLNSFMKLIELQEKRYGNQFTYTLITSDELDLARTQVENLDDSQQKGLTDNA